METGIINKFIEKIIEMTIQEKIVWNITHDQQKQLVYIFRCESTIESKKNIEYIRVDRNDEKINSKNLGLCIYVDENKNYEFGKYISDENKDRLYRTIKHAKTTTTKEEEIVIEKWMDEFLK